MLKPAHRTLCLRSEDTIYLEPLSGVSRTASELELLLYASNRITLTALFDLNDQSRPCLWTYKAISG
jgi:hypothetical protein